MGWFDDTFGAVQGAYQWKTRLINERLAASHTYTTPDDTTEDNTDEQQYTTQVVFGTPLRETKCLFVPEMNDFYTDEELNTIYHSADEYRNAVKKYGLIYKSQKFENADTTQKLLDYAKDWIKNNYHGGIANFNVTALDLHLLGFEVRKLLTGCRVPVVYLDPAIGTETTQTLTVISAEYDLNNPDRNQYKIGIPDVTLNKVYGETSKSGGGGGGGGKSSDETDDETNTEVDGIDDMQDKMKRELDSTVWAMLYRETKEGNHFDLSSVLTPGEKEPTGDWVFGMVADKIKSSNLYASLLEVKGKITGKYINATGGVDTDTLSANTSNTGRTNATSIDVLNNSNFYKDVEVHETTKTKDLEASNNVTAEETVKGKAGEFTTLTVNGVPISGSGITTQVQVTIDNQRYTLVGKEGW